MVSVDLYKKNKELKKEFIKRIENALKSNLALKKCTIYIKAYYIHWIEFKILKCPCKSKSP
jgi:hypothetical protein